MEPIIRPDLLPSVLVNPSKLEVLHVPLLLFFFLRLNRRGSSLFTKINFTLEDRGNDQRAHARTTTTALLTFKFFFVLFSGKATEMSSGERRPGASV